MTTAFSRIFRTTAATSVMAVLLAAGAAHSTGTRQIEKLSLKTTAAEQAFPDAPFGVDPMVTGPTTTAFKKQQQQAGCAQAVWPNIPTACYPK